MSCSVVAASSEYLKVASPSGLLSNLSALTIGIWFKPVTLTGGWYTNLYNAWLRHGNATDYKQAWLVFNNVNMRCGLNTQTTGVQNITPGLTASTGVWQYAALTYDGSTLIGYLDGVAGGTTQAMTGDIAVKSNEHIIGEAFTGGTSKYLNSLVEDAAVWNRALSADEIASIYDARLSASFFPEGLIRHIPLDCPGDGAGGDFADGDWGGRDEAGSLPAVLGTAPSWSEDSVGLVYPAEAIQAPQPSVNVNASPVVYDLVLPVSWAEGGIVTPIARWDGVPNRRLENGSTLRMAVDAFSRAGITKVRFIVTPASGNYDGASPKNIDVTSGAFNSESGVAEYFTDIDESLFSATCDTFTVAVEVTGDDGGFRDDSTDGWGDGGGLPTHTYTVDRHEDLCAQAEEWTLSSGGTGEYYHDAGVSEPTAIEINGALANKNTLGSLAVGEYGWGDADSLGSNRVYVRITADADPDGQAAGYVKRVLPQAVAWVDATDGDDGTGVVNSVGDPYETIEGATADLVAWMNANTTMGEVLDGCKAYLMEDSYPYDDANSHTTSQEWFTVAAAPGESKAAVLIETYVGAGARATQTKLLAIDGVMIGNGTAEVINLASGPANDALWLNDCDLEGAGTDNGNYYPLQDTRDYQYYTDVYVETVLDGIKGNSVTAQHMVLMRGCEIYDIGGDAIANCPMVISLIADDLDPGDTEVHSDVIQSNHNGAVRNMIYHNIRGTRVRYQGIMWGSTVNTEVCQDLAFINIYFECPEEGAGLINWRRRADHVLFWHCTFRSDDYGGSAMFAPRLADGAPTTLQRASVRGCCFDRLRREDGAGLYSGAFDTNHFVETTGDDVITIGTNQTTGDPAFHSYGRPRAASPMADVLTPVLVPYDLAGKERDDPADAGAYEQDGSYVEPVAFSLVILDATVELGGGAAAKMNTYRRQRVL